MLSEIAKQSCQWLRQTLTVKRWRKPLLGLDIDSTALKLVELSQQAGKLSLERYLVEPLAAGIVDHGALSDLDKTAAAVREAWKKLNTPCKDTAIAIPTTMAFHKTIRVPVMPSNRLETRIEDEIRQLVAFERDEVSLDFQVLDSPNFSPNELNILVCAARRQTVEERVAAVELAGLNVVLVDVECFASIAALGQTLQHAAFATQSSHQPVVLLEISDDRVQYHVVSNHQPIHYRNQVLSNRGTEMLTQEIQRSLQSFLNTVSVSHTGQICHILLSGSHIPADLIGVIELYTGIHPQTVNPFATMINAPSIQRNIMETDAPSLLLACGLALRSFDP